MKHKVASIIPTDAEKIAKRLKATRLALGLTQAQLATNAGLNRNTVVHYERGNAVPGAIELIKLAKALRQSPNQLLSGAEAFFDSESSEPLLVSDDFEATAMRITICLMALDREIQQWIAGLLMSLVKSKKTNAEFAEFKTAIQQVADVIALKRSEIYAIADEAKHIVPPPRGKR